MLHQLHNAFGDLSTFLNNDSLPPTSSRKLLDILNDLPKSRKLKTELAITVDSMESFVKATYVLEGDSALALVAYERISMLYSVISAEHYPNLYALAKSLSGGDVCDQVDAVGWWKVHQSDLPNWSSAFKLVTLVQPSSAAAERVFSLLTSSFTVQQESSLEDYVQLSVMLQYNSRS